LRGADEDIHDWPACNNTKVKSLDEGVRTVRSEQRTKHFSNFLELRSITLLTQACEDALGVVDSRCITYRYSFLSILKSKMKFPSSSPRITMSFIIINAKPRVSLNSNRHETSHTPCVVQWHAAGWQVDHHPGLRARYLMSNSVVKVSVLLPPAFDHGSCDIRSTYRVKGSSQLSVSDIMLSSVYHKR
jgi:hypothetical protein